MRKYSILLVDDEPIITAGTGSHLKEEGYEVTTADSGERAVELLSQSSFDLIITDLVMAPMNGIGVLKKSKEINPETMVIIFTGFGNMNTTIDALRLDADDYILKPCEPEEMNFRVSRCLEKLEIKRKIEIYEDILSVCDMCKKISYDSGKTDGSRQWISVDEFIHGKAKVSIKPVYCPVCAEEFNELGIDIGVDLDDLV